MVKRKTKKSVNKSVCFNIRGKEYHKNCGGTYFLGFIGAVIYYLNTATGFWNGVLGILKALVWPAFLVFEALKYFGA